MSHWMAALALVSLFTSTGWAAERALIDGHVHYSHDAWDMLPPREAVKVLRDAGLKKAFVSSSSDDGTQMLFKEAPDIVVPVLRPYRQRGELSTWFKDATVVDMIAERLAKNTYAGIGEFHIFGADADLPVVRKIVKLANTYNLFLHAHSDADAVDRIFAQDPDARVLWAHSGFVSPQAIAAMLAKHKQLWSDLAFRSDQSDNGKVPDEWRRLFTDFPDRFLIGTDTYTPERWYYLVDHANWSRQWLDDLPAELADNIAYKNAERLINRTVKD
ncbi:MAG: amidohydrolase family protein [Rhodospirillales bacterium]|nr:amidohydrolase family protein [Rhodospirillales bacterium]